MLNRRPHLRIARTAFVLALLGAVAALAAPGAALADEQLGASPTLAGTLGGPGVLTVNATATNTLGGFPAPLQQLVIDIPPGITYNFASTPICPVATITAAISEPPVCPAGSQIGRGTADLGASLGSSSLSETATLDIYLVSRSPVEGEVWGNGTTPIIETLAFPGTFTPAAAPFAEKISVSIPPIPTTPGGPDASVVGLHFTLGGTHTVLKTNRAKHKVKTTVGLFDLPKKCAGGSLPYAATATFADGSSPSITGKVACPR